MRLLLTVVAASCYYALLGAPAVRSVRPASADTASVQSAIDEVWKRGGGTVRLESGDYRIGSVRLRSGVRVDLAENVRIFASRMPDDYGNVFAEDPLEPVAPSVLATRICGRNLTVRRMRGAFCGYGVTNAWITGAAGSVIDGGNCYDPFGEEGYRGPHGVFLVSATNCQISGVTIRNAANYAVYALDSADLTVRNLRITAGHDGVHVEGCDHVRIADCDFRTGDDSIAGFASQDVLVTNCILNSACSPIRLSGRDVLVTDCVADGPACYPHRWTLTDEEKRRGEDLPKNSGRRTVGCFFQGYSEDKVRRDFCPGNIVLRNIRGREAGRFLLVLAGLGGIWQDGPAISDVTFENVTFGGLDLPGVVIAKAGAPMSLHFRNCRFAFKRPQSCLLFGRNVFVTCENVKAENVTGTLFQERQDLTYDDIPEFPSWRLESDEVREKWGLPPLAHKKDL